MCKASGIRLAPRWCPTAVNCHLSSLSKLDDLWLNPVAGFFYFLPFPVFPPPFNGEDVMEAKDYYYLSLIL